MRAVGLLHMDNNIHLCSDMEHTMSFINAFPLSYINPLNTKRRPLYLKAQSVPRCKHFSSRL